MGYLYVIGAGHGGLINNVYQTRGKQSPLWPDNTRLYEGVFNRLVVKAIIAGLQECGIKYYELVPGPEDMPLTQRVAIVNQLHDTHHGKVRYISVHANAERTENGVQLTQASGWEVWHDKNSVDGKAMAADMDTVARKHLKMKMRGLKTQEKAFYVVRNSKCPAILTENGFYTNYDECQYLLSDQGVLDIADVHIKAIKKMEGWPDWDQ